MSTRILRHLSSDDYEPQRPRKLARALGLDHNEYGDFRQAVKTLMRAGRVIRGSGDCITLPDATLTLVGKFRGNVRGFGFVVPESPTDHGDLFIPPGSTKDAITGDTVLARITRRGRGGDDSRVEGEVVEVVERGENRFVGELTQEGGQWIVWPDGHVLHAPIAIPDASSTRARAGDQVVVELTRFPEARQPGRGVIIEVLGKRSDPGVDTISIIRQYRLPEGFSEEVLHDARRAVKECDVEAEADRRDDLRDEIVITIDPDDAKDYDDAISLRSLKGGGMELGVHIADVSHLVAPGRPLDEEARRRGNSVYLPRHVIPMLPEVLSNGLCSLQEGETRLTKSAFIKYDKAGRRKGARFANTAIRSTRRLTYQQATDIIEGRTKGFAPEVVALVKEMEALARRIRKRRLADGMIVLDLHDVDLILDDNGEVIDVRPEDTSFSHTIIEMFMVEANEVVGELFAGLGVPHLRRIHEEPPSDAQKKLTTFLRVLGKPIPKKMDRGEMIRLLDSVRGRPDAFPVHLAVLRSMSQAEYSPREIGHFALASRHYVHFTSPIRRYPDLVIHRLLQMYLEDGLRRKKDRREAPSTETLVEIGRRCSFTERHAEAAERELRQIKILRHLEKHIGDVEPGIVTGVANIGIFVQLQKYQVDGLMRFADMTDDWWDIHQQAGCAVARRSGRRITIGDRLDVQIISVDLAARELNIGIANETSGNRWKESKPRKAKPTNKRNGRSGKRGGGRRSRR